MDAPPAGWYPYDEHSLRFWDGAAWTGRWAPRPGSPTAPPPTAGRPAWTGSPGMVATVIVLAAIVVVLLAVFFSILGFAALGGFGQDLGYHGSYVPLHPAPNR